MDMDREEFLSWLRLMGFVPHPVNNHVWLKTKTSGDHIKVWLSRNDSHIQIRTRNGKSRQYRAGTHHSTFKAAVNKLTNNLGAAQ